MDMHRERVGFSYAFEALVRELGLGGWWVERARDMRHGDAKISDPPRAVKDRFAAYCDEAGIRGDDRERLRESVFE